MKLNKLFLGLLGLAGFVASSCSDSDDYHWATASGEQVYFSNELPSTQEISFNASSFTIPVNRVNTSNSITVPVSIQSTDNFFTAPASVSFAAGEAKADLVISYDPAKLAYDEYKTVKLTIDSLYSTPYGNATYTFKGGIASPYISLGKGTYLDDYYFGASASVTIMQNQEQKNVFRVMAPYKAITGGGDDYLEITLLKPGDTYNGVTVTQNDLVAFNTFNTGYHHPDYDDDIKLYHPSAFNKTNPESNWLNNKVLAYQEDGVTPGQIQLAPWYYMDNTGGWNATGESGAIVITFPGYAPKDFSAAMEYQGVMTSVDGIAYATINAVLGADAANVLAAVVEAGADAEAVADALATGDLEGAAVQNGLNFVQIPDGLTGNLQVVMAVIDGEAVKTVESALFEYYGSGPNPWKSLGIGYYTDDIVVPLFTEAGETYTYEVEILENENTPGLYRLVNLYAPVATAFGEEGGNKSIEINAEHADGVYIVDQLIGLDFGYGDMSIETDAGYYVPQYGYDVVMAQLPQIFGKVENGEITFPVLQSQSGKDYQIWLNMGDDSYLGGTHGAMKIVLPTAAAGVMAKARRSAKASNFALRLNGGQAISMKDMRIMKNRRAPLTKAQMIAE